ncbi:hypothetical protein [Leadbettera azotonutricia]|uniref:Uncharacterized protein n=1 Tax=Leadbettera azotonutricia (strain ATCC BAA-888 / DSM 13862 / ZAS-9) TaxID=545695 RepID=F5Y862_LEAAZ|nr:hypothetical protein [Leadbettera azotonutricia]AEF81491.1 conserved hypothetical protein [Leadbettera azotonutricia ZAS-9]
MVDKEFINVIPSDVLEEVQDMIQEISGKLEPYVMALTPSERRKMPKMGRKSLSFVEKAEEYARKNPNMCPGFLTTETFEAVFSTAHELWKFTNSVKQLTDNLQDTELAAGSKAYLSALDFYKSVKIAAMRDIPGAKAIYEELRSRFPHRKHREEEGETKAQGQ